MREKIGLAGIAILTLGACSSIDCPVQNVVATVWELRKSTGALDTLAYDTLTISSRRSNGSDTILLNQSTSTANFELPVSYTAPEDTLKFLLTNKQGEQKVSYVYLKKENYPHFESVDCSAAFFHKLTAVSWTGDAIDSIGINKSYVDYDLSTSHLHIYFNKSTH